MEELSRNRWKPEYATMSLFYCANFQENELKGREGSKRIYNWYEEQLLLKPQLVAGTAGKRNSW